MMPRQHAHFIHAIFTLFLVVERQIITIGGGEGWELSGTGKGTQCSPRPFLEVYVSHIFVLGLSRL